MTLHEWKAMQKEDRVKVEFHIQKANQRADAQTKKEFVLYKSKSEEAHAEESVMDHPLQKPSSGITLQRKINLGNLGRPPPAHRGGQGGTPEAEGGVEPAAAALTSGGRLLGICMTWKPS